MFVINKDKKFETLLTNQLIITIQIEQIIISKHPKATDKQMLQKKLTQQQKTIEYLKTKYKQKTGQQIIMPKKWEDYLMMDQQQVPLQNIPSVQKLLSNNASSTANFPTFQHKYNSYQLPSRLSYTKPPLTNFSPANPFHMIQVIDLGGFKDKGFTKVAFRELLNRIVEMRCLKAVALAQNGIDDTCAEEIETLLGMKKITRVNLSQNDMQKTCLQIISKNFNHLQWIDISRNKWTFQYLSLVNLMNSIRTNTKLYHLCLTLQDQRLVKTLTSMLKIKTNINSFALIDTKYDQQSMTNIAVVLQTMQGKKQNPNRILSLNFKYCYLETQPFAILLKALSNNMSLISLNLANNQLMEGKAISLLAVIESHLCLVYLNLEGNELENKFAAKLAEILAKNQILQEVIIDRNNMSDDGAKLIYETLREHNQTLESLGRIETNQRISSEYLQKISKALRINKISKDIRAQISAQEGQLPATQIAKKQTQAFLEAEYQEYQLLEPIAITNPLRHDPYQINLWQFD